MPAKVGPTSLSPFISGQPKKKRMCIYSGVPTPSLAPVGREEQGYSSSAIQLQLVDSRPLSLSPIPSAIYTDSRIKSDDVAVLQPSPP